VSKEGLCVDSFDSRTGLPQETGWHFSGFEIGSKAMSIAQVLRELPGFSVSDRQLLIREALGLDEPGLPAEDVELVESRLAAWRLDPSSSVPLDEMKSRLLDRFPR
jgi:hypothetical protein